MSTQILIDGIEYDLPKFTVDVAERMSAIGSISDIREKSSAMYGLVSDVIDDADVLKDILDGDDVKSIDLTTLCNVYTMIDNAYLDAMSSEKDRRVKEQLVNAKDAIDMLDKANKAIATTGRTGRKR